MESLLSLAKKETRGRNASIEVLIAIIVIIFSSILSSLAFIPIFKYIQIKNPNLKMDNIVIIASLYATIGMSLAVIFYCKVIEKRKLKTMGFRKKGILINYLKGLIYGLVLFTLSFLISIFLGGTKIIGINNQVDFKLLILIFGGFILQGMSEEIFCRGYLMMSILRKNSVYSAVILNSLSFSLLHIFNDGINLISLINIFLVGIVFSIFMLIYDNIYIVGAMHSMWNFAQGNIFGGKVSGIDLNETILHTSQIEGKELFSGGIFGIEGSLATTIVLIGTIFILIKVSNKKQNYIKV